MAVLSVLTTPTVEGMYVGFSRGPLGGNGRLSSAAKRDAVISAKGKEFTFKVQKSVKGPLDCTGQLDK